MADRRKLQGEIERCLKRVGEGVEQFEDIWQKVHTTTNASQREKYEADLKKEIKKLQRLRDQIKTWMASSDIKDKSILVENRKIIETQMERFRAAEREMKTKAYSKEGLDGAQMADPTQREKKDMTAWLSNSIETLGIHVDQFESELESLTQGLKKKNDNQVRADELKTLLSRHKYHILQLETLMRMLDNGTIEVCKISDIKDDVEYYIEACQDPDFKENEFLYDDLDLPDVDDSVTNAAMSPKLDHTENCALDAAASSKDVAPGAGKPASTNSSSPMPDPGQKSDGKLVKGSQGDRTSTSAVKSAMSATAVARSTTAVPIIHWNESSWLQSRSNSSPSVNLLRSHSVWSPLLTPCDVNAATSSKDTPSTLPESTATSSGGTMNYWDNFHQEPSPVQPKDDRTANSVPKQLERGASVMKPENAAPSYVAALLYGSLARSKGTLARTEDWPSLPTAPSPLPQNGPLPNNCGDSMASSTPIVDQAVLNTDVESHVEPLSSLLHNVLQKSSQQTAWQEQHQQQEQVQTSCERSMLVFSEGPSNEVLRPPSAATTEVRTPTVRAMAPTGAAPLSKECSYQLRLLEAASMHMPQPRDSELQGLRFQRTPTAVPDYYPQNYFTSSETMALFEKLETETLFSAFYRMDGSRAQYLAAKTLKKQSWRFHTKLMKWFKRSEEPTVITEEYEQGTYTYFDYEQWSQRQMEGFTFEYKYLEDKELE